jgi:hypothetical protein
MDNYYLALSQILPSGVYNQATQTLGPGPILPPALGPIAGDPFQGQYLFNNAASPELTFTFNAGNQLDAIMRQIAYTQVVRNQGVNQYFGPAGTVNGLTFPGIATAPYFQGNGYPVNIPPAAPTA